MTLIHPDSPSHAPPFKAYAIKNILLALGLVVFLAISFKLAGALTEESTSISQSDSIFSDLQAPAVASVPADKDSE